MASVGILHRKELAIDRIRPDVLEIMVEHFLGRPVPRGCPLIGHGVDASLGTDVEWPAEVYDRRAEVLRDAEWFGEHIAFTKVPGRDLGHLAPLPFTSEAVRVVARNARRMEDRIPCPLILENIAYYARPPGPLSEPEFLRAVLDESGCGWLLDLNNLHANAVNHGYDARAFLDEMPLDRVVEIHIAGGSWEGPVFVDSHATAVGDPVWALLEDVLDRCSPKAVVLERDSRFPSPEALAAELERARRIHVPA